MSAQRKNQTEQNGGQYEKPDNISQTDHKATQNGTTKLEQSEPKKRGLKAVTSFVLDHAFVITLIMNTMAESLGKTVRGQYRYRYFHSLYADELSQYNVTSGCGAEQVPQVQAIENKVTQLSERWRMYDNYVMVFPMVAGALFLGMKSDQVGRRFIFLFNTATTMLDYITFAIVIKFKLHLAYTFIGLFIWSVTAGELGMAFATYALVTDTHGKEEEEEEGTNAGDSQGIKANDRGTQNDTKVKEKVSEEEANKRKYETSSDDLDETREKSRGLKFVLIDILRLSSRGVVQLVTGYIIEYAGFFYTLVITLACKSVIFLFAYIFVKETGKQKKSVQFLGPLKKIFKALKDPWKRTTLLLVNFGLLFALFSYVDEYGVLRTYQMSPPFCFNAIQLGWFSGVDYFKTVVNIPLLAGFRRLQMCESSIASLGMLAAGIATLLIALIRQVWVFYVATIIAAPGDLSLAMSRIITSRVVGRGALASTLALVLSMEMVAWFVASQASSYLYQYTLDVLPTAAFFMATAFFSLAASLFGGETCHRRLSPKDREKKDEENAGTEGAGTEEGMTRF